MPKGMTDEEHLEKKGHLPEYRYNKKPQGVQRTCIICDSLKHKRKSQDPDFKARKAESDRKYNAKKAGGKVVESPPESAPKLNRSEREHQRLTGRPPRRDAPKIFDLMLDDPDTYGRPNCDGDTRFTEYDSEDPEQPNPPSLQMAQAMCDGCPLKEICLEATLVRGARQVYHGVYASGVYENGRRVK